MKTSQPASLADHRNSPRLAASQLSFGSDHFAARRHEKLAQVFLTKAQVQPSRMSRNDRTASAAARG